MLIEENSKPFKLVNKKCLSINKPIWAATNKGNKRENNIDEMKMGSDCQNLPVT